MDVTVNIRGNASDLEKTLDDVSNRTPPPSMDDGRQTAPPNPDRQPSQPNTPPSGATSNTQSVNPQREPLPPAPDQRFAPNAEEQMRARGVPTGPDMIQDVNREIQQRGVLMVPGSSSVTQIINTYTQTQRRAVDESITEKYQGRREDLKRRIGEAYEGVDADIERQRQEGLQNLGPKANDPFYTSVLNQRLEGVRERQYGKVGREFDEEESQLSQDENTERLEAEKNLTEAVRELTDYFERQAETPLGETEPILSRLRSERTVARQEMEAATTPEELQAARERLGGLDEKLKSALYGTNSSGPNVLGTFQGMASGASSAMNLDLGGLIMGGAGASSSLMGLSGKSATRFLAGAYIASMVARGVQQAVTAQAASENYSGNLGAFRGTVGGNTGRLASGMAENLSASAYDASTQAGGIRMYDATDFGMSADEFRQRAIANIRMRGTSNDWKNETYRQIGMEGSMGLENGYLTNNAKYDRYGITVTEALNKMVTSLSRIEGSGVDNNDFTRVQERFETLQSVMASYYERTGTPNYDTANRMVAGYSAIQGINKDQRLGGYMETMSNLIQNPPNDRMKVMLYDVVSELFPETQGKTADIIRKLRNPDNEGAITSAYASRWRDMYGDPETSDAAVFMGEAFLGGIPFDQRGALMRGLSTGKSAEILRTSNASFTPDKKAGDENINGYIIQSVALQSDVNQAIKGVTDWMKNGMMKDLREIIWGNKTSPRSNSTRQ